MKDGSKENNVFRVTGLKFLYRVGTHTVFFIIFFLGGGGGGMHKIIFFPENLKKF